MADVKLTMEQFGMLLLTKIHEESARCGLRIISHVMADNILPVLLSYDVSDKEHVEIRQPQRIGLRFHDILVYLVYEKPLPQIDQTQMNGVSVADLIEKLPAMPVCIDTRMALKDGRQIWSNVTGTDVIDILFNMRIATEMLKQRHALDSAMHPCAAPPQ